MSILVILLTVLTEGKHFLQIIKGSGNSTLFTDQELPSDCVGDLGFHQKENQKFTELVVSGVLSRVGCSGLLYLAGLRLLTCRPLMASSAQSCQDGEKAGTDSKYTNAQYIKNIFVLNYNKGGRRKRE